MAKIGRNDLCPCGSGKKYKRCCMTNDEAAARATLAADAAHQQSHLCHDCSDQLDDSANAVFALIDARKFDAAEQAAHDVLAASPACMTATSVLVGSMKPKATTARRPIAIGRSSSSPATSRTSMTRNS